MYINVLSIYILFLGVILSEICGMKLCPKSFRPKRSFVKSIPGREARHHVLRLLDPQLEVDGAGGQLGRQIFQRFLRGSLKLTRSRVTR
jgi:hypothetical protein